MRGLLGYTIFLAACATGPEPTAVLDDDASADARGIDAAAPEPSDPPPVSWSSSQPTCGQVLTRSTKLRRDLGPCPDIGLVLGADDITLDCDGHRIYGAAGANIGVKAQDRAGLHIEDCRIDGFGTSIELRETIGSYVEDNHVESVDAIDGVGDTVRDNDIGPGTSAITGHAGRFVDNEMAGPDSLLLVVGTGMRVSGNDIEGSVEFDGTAHRFDDNDVRGGGVLVDYTSGGRFDDNTLRDGFRGFAVLDSSHNRFEDNTVEDNEDYGFRLWGGVGSSRNLLRDNVADGNGILGFSIDYGSNGNVLDDNDACDNDEADLRDDGAQTVLFDNDFCVIEGM
jgi:parallel beta-helix repeat protein